MSVLWCWVLIKSMDNLFWVFLWCIGEVRLLDPKKICSECVICWGKWRNYCLSMSCRSLWNAGCYLYAFDGIKKAFTALITDIFSLVKKSLILCHMIAHHYICQSESDLEWLTGHSILWLRWRVYESHWDLTLSVTHSLIYIFK